MPPESNEKWNHQAGDDDGPVVLMLPENDRIAAQPDLVFADAIRRCIEEPPAVTVPESPRCIVGVFVRVRAGVMADVVCTPDQCRVLQCPSAGNQGQPLDPIRAVKTLMRHQPVIADRDPHPRHDVHDEKVHPVKQRIADIVAVEGNANDRGGGDHTKEETGTVGKS